MADKEQLNDDDGLTAVEDTHIHNMMLFMMVQMQKDMHMLNIKKEHIQMMSEDIYKDNPSHFNRTPA